MHTEEEIIEAIKKYPYMNQSEINNLPGDLKTLLSKSWDELTDTEKEYFLIALETEPGSINHAAMIAGTKEERKTALKVLKEMKNICIRENEELTGSREFNDTSAGELLAILERTVR